MVVLHFYKLRIRYSGTKVRSVPQAPFSISIFVRFLLCQKPDNMALEQFSKSTPQAKNCLNKTIFQVVPGTDTYYNYIFRFFFPFSRKKVVKREEYFPSEKFQFSLCLPLPLLSYLTKFHFRILVKFTRKFEMLCLIFKQKRLSLDL